MSVQNPLLINLWALVAGKEERTQCKKDRDIGYALAANSCEGADDVDTCTIAVF